MVPRGHHNQISVPSGRVSASSLGASGSAAVQTWLQHSFSPLRLCELGQHENELARLAPSRCRVIWLSTKPIARRGFARFATAIRFSRYAFAGALRAFFIGDLIAAGVVSAAAARAARFGFAAGAGVGTAALRPSPIDFAIAERVAA